MSSDFLTSTFSILGYDPDVQEWGVAVQSKTLAVGTLVPFARANIGAIATQSSVNIAYGARGLALLKSGHDPKQVIQELLSRDKLAAQRQLAVMDARGHATNYTGLECPAWAGGIAEPNVSVQGNSLAGERVLTAMMAIYKKTEGKLAARLIAGLAAGQRAGGDTRGQQSAALIVVREKSDENGVGDGYVNLRVDDHATPIAELRRLYEIWEKEYFPYLESERINTLLRAKKYALAQHLHRVYAADAERLARKYPDDAHLIHAFAWMLAKNQFGLDAALKHARRAVKLQPDNPDVQDTLAHVLFQRGDVAQAVKIERGLVAQQPDNAHFQKQLKKFEKATRKAT